MGQALASPCKNEATVKNKANGDDEATARDNEPTTYDVGTANVQEGQLDSAQQYLPKIKESYTVTKNSQTMKNR